MVEYINLILITCILHTTLAARILGVFPTPSISHQVVYRALTLELAKRGHELTVITTDPIDNPPNNFHQIDVHNASYDVWRRSFNFTDFGIGKKHRFDFFHDIFNVYHTVFAVQMNDPKVKEILKRSKDFDLLLVEPLFPLSYAFAHVIKAPYIGVNSMVTGVNSYDAVGNPEHPILYPDITHEKLTDFTLWDKTINVVLYLLGKVYLEYLFGQHSVKRDLKVWFGDDCPSPIYIEKNVDLLIMNTYPLISGIKPLVPSIVTTGGLHIQPKQLLPKDLLAYLDNSKRGVIYFSFGSNVKSKDLPREVIDVFLDVFSKLPYDILWKFEDEHLTGKPANLKISKWFPQNDLFGHENIKLFITQGGQQSIDEAIQNEIPVLVIPFMADQHYNAERAKILNIGLRLDLASITSAELRNKIETIIDNPSFKGNVTKLRDLINDQPESGLERAVWWVEYVIRHKGAKHLRSPAADATWIEYYMLDVFGAVFALAALVLTLFVYVLLLLMRIFRRLSSLEKTKIKQN